MDIIYNNNNKEKTRQTQSAGENRVDLVVRLFCQQIQHLKTCSSCDSVQTAFNPTQRSARSSVNESSSQRSHAETLDLFEILLSVAFACGTAVPLAVERIPKGAHVILTNSRKVGC